MAESNDIPLLPSHVVAERSHVVIPSLPNWIEPTVEFLRRKAVLGGVCEETRSGKLLIALHEAISNAILHGNRQNPRKLVTVRAFLNSTSWGVEISDQGEGFDWKMLLKKIKGPPDTESSSGRGIALIQASGARLYFLSGGRRIIFVRKRAASTKKEPGKLRN